MQQRGAAGHSGLHLPKICLRLHSATNAAAMSLDRRDFVRSTLAATATAAFASPLAAEGRADDSAGIARECYELRCYHLKAGTRLKAEADPAPLHAYLAQAVVPALSRRGIRSVGVFTELDINREAATSTPRAGSPVWMLIPHASAESYVNATADLLRDPAVLAAGAAYLNVPKASPAFERIDSWFLRAFRGMPRIELPAFSRDKVATRVFEMRDYESHSELKALNKMAMFDDAEIQLMRDLGMSPVFFGQALSGPNLPHLRYITSGPSLAAHLGAWAKFGPDPRWIAMRDDPKYAENTSSNTARFLAPTPYSQI